MHLILNYFANSLSVMNFWCRTCTCRKTIVNNSHIFYYFLIPTRMHDLINYCYYFPPFSFFSHNDSSGTRTHDGNHPPNTIVWNLTNSAILSYMFCYFQFLFCFCANWHGSLQKISTFSLHTLSSHPLLFILSLQSTRPFIKISSKLLVVAIFFICGVATGVQHNKLLI